MKRLRINSSDFIALYWDLVTKKLRIGCITLIVFSVMLITIPYIDLYIGLLRISIKTGVVSPTVSGLQIYLDETLTSQMSRDEVNELFLFLGTKVKIRNFSRENEICDFIGLYIGYWPLNRMEYVICYDEKLRFKSSTPKEPS